MELKINYRKPLELLGVRQDEQRAYFHNLTRVGRLLLTKKYQPEHKQMLKNAVDYFEKGAMDRAKDIEESVIPRLIEHFALPTEPMHVILKNLQQEVNQTDSVYAKLSALGRQLLDAIATKGVKDPDALQPGLQSFRLAIREAWGQAEELFAKEREELWPVCADILEPTEILRMGKEMAGRRGDPYRGKKK